MYVYLGLPTIVGLQSKSRVSGIACGGKMYAEPGSRRVVNKTIDLCPDTLLGVLFGFGRFYSQILKLTREGIQDQICENVQQRRASVKVQDEHSVVLLGSEREKRDFPDFRLTMNPIIFYEQNQGIALGPAPFKDGIPKRVLAQFIKKFAMFGPRCQ